MKILVVAHNSFLDGGANRSLLMVIDMLKQKYGVELVVLVPKKRGPFVDELNKRNICWIQCPYYGCTSNIRGDKYDVLRLGRITFGYWIECLQGFKMAKKLRNQNFDLVYTNTRVISIGAKIAKHIKVPHVCHVREFGSVRPLWGFWGYKSIYKHSEKIILISNALKNKFMEYVSGDKLITIHNGINTDLGLYVNFGKDDKNINILLTARLDPEKGHFDALNALKNLLEEGYTDVRLHIAGSESNTAHIGWYKESITKFIKDNHLDNHVIMHGEVQNMHDLRKKMSIELMCAVCETFGRVTVEGMRNGLCVIGSNTGGTPEIIKDGETGLLYEQGNYIDLSNKLKLVIDNSEYRMKLARKGYEFSQNHFTPDNNVSKIYKVLRDCVE